MSYQVLARKWRPRSFEQMVGQDAVRRVLTHALEQQRLHHAYLFTGTRGVGKTTLGRILAKCLNCEVGITAQPCGQCAACREIDEGRCVDLIEVDAASRTKVEDTRELLDNVQYAPTRGRFKVYLIDEVHMLSGHSFNALLKTLEEPPPHIEFLLATTEPRKLPVTVLSRCLQFNLKRIPAEQIAAYLGHVLEAEGIEAEAPALKMLARAADGSMRDGLSLLDQSIAFGGGRVSADEVQELLGGVPEHQLSALALGLADGDAPAAMEAVQALAQHAADFSVVLADLISLLHEVALHQAVPESAPRAEQREHVERLAAKLAAEDVQLYYQIALMGRRDLPLAVDPQAGFEMIVLRMLSFAPAALDDVRPATPPGAAADTAAPSAAGESGAVAPTPAHGDSQAQAWPQLLGALQLKGVALALASNCSLEKHADEEIVLTLEDRHAGLCTLNAERRLKQALSDHLGHAVRLKIRVGEHSSAPPAVLASHEASERQRAAEQAIDNDGVVQAFKESLGARVVPGSVKPRG